MTWTTVFANGPHGGNPCPVVHCAADWPTGRMQSLAGRSGAEATFVLPAQDGGDLRLRYFVPRHEMDVCVHATVAATVVHARSGLLARNPAVVETPLGLRRVAWDADVTRPAGAVNASDHGVYSGV